MNTLNEQAKAIHAANAHWWQDIHTGERVERNPYELLALVVSELAEALEGTRKDLMDDHLPHRKMAEVELADAKIRLLDLAGGLGIDIEPVEYGRIYFDGTKSSDIYWLIYLVMECRPKTSAFGSCIFQAIRGIEDYAKKYGYDLHGATTEKLAYNKTREDHTHTARKQTGGKLF